MIIYYNPIKKGLQKYNIKIIKKKFPKKKNYNIEAETISFEEIKKKD